MDEKAKEIRCDALIIDLEYRYEKLAATEEGSKISDMDTCTFSRHFHVAADGGSTGGESYKDLHGRSRRRSN
ncbi:predicted protein [Sclerotinia sclerotiorum 1980 UF-70]|uniref:Uncharacterized protein n=1 Tax=Sclerotinia sclerotiorum (strain ATCC 18683 / 1980 / Ss-1) TaxID=665079 RepID=A7ET72_SCLS1|nr:predicted protein [Sclerotinia sclerotiorum 1980 UF-70]EDN92664.1 predicted protein [Sclerotinia sclerotiorum 1980 UF-70]